MSPVSDGFPRVAGVCPMGCGETLFLANAGHVTCSYLPCPNPCAADEILHDRETEHIVVLTDESFSIQHPLRERLNGELFDCGLHQWMCSLSGPPRREGRYRVRSAGPDWFFAPAPSPTDASTVPVAEGPNPTEQDVERLTRYLRTWRNSPLETDVLVREVLALVLGVGEGEQHG